MVANGVHDRWPAQFVTAIRIDRGEAGLAEASRLAGELGAHCVRGDVLFATCDPREGGLTALAARWDALARRLHGVLAGELVASLDGAPLALARALEGALAPAAGEWLVGQVDSSDHLRGLDPVLTPGTYECAAGAVIVRHARVRPEDGFAVSRFAHAVTVVEGDTLVLEVTYLGGRGEHQPLPAVEQLRADLDAHLGTDGVIEPPLDDDDEPTFAVRTRSPLTTLRSLSRFAHAHHLDAWVRPRAPRPLEAAVHRLAGDVALQDEPDA